MSTWIGDRHRDVPSAGRIPAMLADYLASQPRARRLVTIEGDRRGQPWWWEGIVVLAWTARDG
jgi:hypothetical protein